MIFDAISALAWHVRDVGCPSFILGERPIGHFFIDESAGTSGLLE